MAVANPVEYIRQVRAEMKKVTWPTRQETTVSVIAVFMMVLMASMFLFFADQIIAFVIKNLLNLGMN